MLGERQQLGVEHLDIDSFVPRSEIDQRFFDTPYYTNGFKE